MQDLQQKLESAAYELVDSLALSCGDRALQVFTGLDIDEQYKPSVTMIALSGQEFPQGSGNFTLSFSAVVASNANDVSIEQHRELCRLALAPLSSDDTAEQLSAAVPALAVQGISNRSCVERVVDSNFETELSFDCYCCGLAIAD